MLYETSSLIFLSTLSLRRATNDAINGCNPDIISIHALLAESDAPWLARLASRSYFYPRSPCGERPSQTNLPGKIIKFLSTLSLRRATRILSSSLESFTISIHALLAESDMMLLLTVCMPCVFLSTLSLRRATIGFH